MKLHRTDQRPTWEALKPHKRNGWQRLAARTKGVITPGNIISVIGFWFVCFGAVQILQGSIMSGAMIILIGRLCDVLDGIVAHTTGTISPLGEAVDAMLDKLAILVIIIVCAVMIPSLWPWLAVLFAQNSINSLVAAMAKRRRITLHPSRAGKVSTALQWVGLIGLLFTFWPVVSWLAYACLLVGLGLGFWASYRYIKVFFD